MINRIKWLFLTLMSVTFAGTAPAMAQSFPLDEMPDQRVSVGITIPLGGSRTDRQARSPRLEVTSQYRSGRRDWNDHRVEPVRNYDAERRIGISLNEEPRFYVNGREFDLRDEDRRLGVSTAVIVVGAVVLVGVVVATASNFNDLSPNRE